MSHPAAGTAGRQPLRLAGEPLRVAVLGPAVWVDGCARGAAAPGLSIACFGFAGGEPPQAALEAIAVQRAHLTVIFDPCALPAEVLAASSGTRLGVLVDGLPDPGTAPALSGLDRLVSFLPSLTGSPVGATEVWRAIPPPVSDSFYAPVARVREPPRAIAIGRSTARREEMLMPAKHHHDLLQVVHGVTGTALVELMEESDVGVYVPPGPERAFGAQAGMHLAAGQLLLAAGLAPAHGLEPNLDYLSFDSPEGLVWVLDRLVRFPEMYQRIRVRGRLKAEQYRASRVLARLAHDVLADVAAFGPGARSG